MASQRPPWFRFPNIGARAPAPAPPQPPVVRPAIPVRPPPPQPQQPQEPAPPQPPPSQPAPAPAPAPPQPPIVRPAIPVRAPPPPPQPAQPQEAAPPQQPPPQPAAPPPKNSPTPSPVQPKSPEVVASRPPPPPKEQVPSPPRRSVTPTPPPPLSSPVNQTQKVASPRPSPTPPAPLSPPERRAKPLSPSVRLNTTATTNVPDDTAAKGSVKAATPAALSPKEVVKLQSPPIVEKTSTPIQSPKAEARPLSQPNHPSPLKLPPAHFNSTTADDHQFEQKNVLVQDKMSKPPADKMHQDIPNSANHNHSNNSANGKQAMKDKAASGKKHHDHSGTKMITLAGENKGAVMELTSSPNSPNSQREKSSSKIFSGKPRTLLKEKKTRLDGDHSSSESGEEAGRNTGKGKAGRATAHQSPPTNAIFNSNVQGINNSIVLNSNLSHKDPGVHFSLARKANGGHSKEYPNQYHHQG